jgi:hypothetical protein
MTQYVHIVTSVVPLGIRALPSEFPTGEQEFFLYLWRQKAGCFRSSKRGVESFRKYMPILPNTPVILHKIQRILAARN